VAAACYGAPPGWIGREVSVQWNELHVRLLDPPDRRTAPSARAATEGAVSAARRGPPVAYSAPIRALLDRARNAGEHVCALCERIHHAEGELAARRILGLLSPAREHGAAATDEAAKAALGLQVPTYRFVRRFLERRLPVPLSLRQVDPLIRQLTVITTSSTTRLERPHEPDGTRPSSAQVASLGNGRCPRESASPGAGRDTRTLSTDGRRWVSPEG
jgi:hypothetical protein